MDTGQYQLLHLVYPNSIYYLLLERNCQVMDRKAKNRYASALLLIAFETIVGYLLMNHIQKDTEVHEINVTLFSDVQMFIILGFGLGLTAWSKNKIQTIYWVLIGSSLFIQLSLLLSNIKLDAQISSNMIGNPINSIARVINGSASLLIAMSVIASASTPLGVVLFSLLGAVGFSAIYFAQEHLIGKKQRPEDMIEFFDPAGNITIIFYGSLLGLCFSLFHDMCRKETLEEKVDEQNFIHVRLKTFGLLIMVLMWPSFISSNLGVECLLSQSTKIVMAEFGGLMGAIFSGFIIRDVETQPPDFYLYGCICGAISIGNCFLLLENVWLILSISYLTTLFALILSHFLSLKRFMILSSPTRSKLLTCFFIPSFFSYLIQAIFFPQEIPASITSNCPQSQNNYLLSSIYITTSIQSSIFIFIVIVALTIGLILALLYRLCALEKSEEESQYLEIEEENNFEMEYIRNPQKPNSPIFRNYHDIIQAL